MAKQGIDPGVRTLATQIKAEQTPEIDQMSGWLTGWGRRASASTDMGHGMGGTMSPAEISTMEELLTGW